MKSVSIHQAKNHLEQLIHEALSGEDIIIFKSQGNPVIRLSVIHPTPKRVIGLLANKITISEDFKDSLDDFKDYMPKKKSKRTSK